jgi:hypothetical protein
MRIVGSAMGERPSVDGDVRKRTLNDSDVAEIRGQEISKPAAAFVKVPLVPTTS